jgi:parallel beta-helix repeat protein
MRCAIYAFIIVTIPTIAIADTIVVPDDQPTIQAGIDAAVDGEMVLVKPDTYVENIDFLGKAITVKSKKGPKITVIDGSLPANPDFGSVAHFQSGESTDSVLEGFTLTNGSGYTNDGINFSGGGVLCNYSSPTIRSNIIVENHVTHAGGGIACRHSSSPIIINNLLLHNTAQNQGGAIQCWDSSHPIILNNILFSNSAVEKGGGLYCRYNSEPIIMNCTINNNYSALGGGISCAFAAHPNINNTILWNDHSPSGKEIHLSNDVKPSCLTIDFSDVQGGLMSVVVESWCRLVWGKNMIDADPLFINPDNGDFHLTYPSPCKDTGDNSAVTELEDFEGDPRIAYGTVDMGADEFHTHLYYVPASHFVGSVTNSRAPLLQRRYPPSQLLRTRPPPSRLSTDFPVSTVIRSTLLR